MRVKRRINHTGRKRIERADVAVLLNDGAGPPEFDAELKLEDYELPDKAEVYVEAYYKSSTQRFSFGTVGKLVKPKRRALDQIDLGGRVLFRVKVVDVGANAGRLLAAAEKVPAGAEDEQDKDHLVSVLQKDLGNEVWRMELSTDNNPVLILNSSIPDAIGQVKTNPLFQGLLLPAVIREILTFLYWDEEGHFDDNSWQGRWLDYCESLTGSEPPSDPQSEDIRSWMDDVVESFSQQFKLQPRLTEQLLGGAS